MKKKRTILVIVAVVLCVAITGVLLSAGRYSCSTAYYLKADNGQHLAIIDSSPVSVSGDDEMFSSFSDGDKILLIHDGIAESYPGQTKAYFCFKISEGEREDIDNKLLSSLSDLGWIQ